VSDYDNRLSDLEDWRIESDKMLLRHKMESAEAHEELFRIIHTHDRRLDDVGRHMKTMGDQILSVESDIKVYVSNISDDINQLKPQLAKIDSNEAKGRMVTAICTFIIVLVVIFANAVGG
jgi:CHASE3 domain sensor protein